MSMLLTVCALVLVLSSFPSTRCSHNGEDGSNHRLRGARHLDEVLPAGKETCPGIRPRTPGAFLELAEGLMDVDGSQISQYSFLSQNALIRACDVYYGDTGEVALYWKDKQWVNQHNLIALSFIDGISCLKDGVVIFVGITMLDSFFRNVYDQLKVKFVLVTGLNSDDPVPKSDHLERYLLAKDSKVIHWYSQNCNTNAYPTRFSCLPEGLVFNSYWYPGKHVVSPIEINAHKSKDLFVQFGETSRDVPTMRKQRVDPSYDVLVPYMNIGTHLLRQKLSQMLCNRDDFSHNEEFTYVHEESGVISRCLPNQDLTTMNAAFAVSKFVACPPGKGMDTHRFWEIIHFGSYPIVITSHLDAMFVDLPVVIIQDWQDLSKALLDQKYNEFVEKNWSYDILKPTVWEATFGSYGYERYDYSQMFTSMNVSTRATEATMARYELQNGDIIRSIGVVGYHHLENNTRREIMYRDLFEKNWWEFSDVKNVGAAALNAFTIGEDLIS